jgi:hypothetical protein
MAVGQVDVLVGLPTLNHSDSVGPVVRAAHVAFNRELARERTALVNVDGGSADGTPDIVRDASIVERETLVASQSLRTRHRISGPYHGVPGKAAALRTVFAAADLLQARAVVVLDPEIASVTPESVAALARPALAGEADFVSPAYARHPLDGPARDPGGEAPLPRRLRAPAPGAPRRRVRLLGALRRALPRGAGLGQRRPAPRRRPVALRGGGGRQPAGGGGARSARAASPPAPGPAWPPSCRRSSTRSSPACACRRPRGPPAPVPRGELARHGAAPPGPPPAPAVDVAGFATLFREGVVALGGMLEPALRPATLDALRRVASTDGRGASRRAVGGGRRGARRRPPARRDLARPPRARRGAPLPRARGLLRRRRVGLDAAAAEERLEDLCRTFERSRSELVALWTAAPGR